MARQLSINTRETLLKNKVLFLEVDKNLKPKWSEKSYLPIFVPNIYKSCSQGKTIATFRDPENNKEYPAIEQNGNKTTFNFDPKETEETLTYEKYVRKHIPLQSKLPFHYHKIPFRFYVGKVQSKIYALRKKEKIFPSWPYESSVEFLRHIYSKCRGEKNRLENAWENKKICLALTHDVDTSEGLKNVRKFVKLEEKYNLNATWFFVPKYYKHDHELLSYLKGKGNEIGCHDYNHNGKLPYMNEEEIRKKLNECKGLIKKYDMKGFRSASMLSSDKLDKILPDYFSYESTYADTELVSPDANNRGACTVFPYYKKGFLQIPHTLPMDSSLLFLGYKPKKIVSAWINKIEFINSIGGLAMIDTHAEPHFSGQEKMLKAYEEFLNYVDSKRNKMWITNLNNLAEYWKKKFPI